MVRLVSVLAAMTVICGPAAVAQVPPYVTVIDGATSPTEIPVAEATFVFFEQVVALEAVAKDLGLGLLAGSLQLESGPSRELLTAIQIAVSSAREFGSKLSAEMCLGASSIVTSQQMVAAFTKVDHALEKEKERLISRTVDTISAEDRPKLEDFINNDYRRQLRGQRINYAKWLEVTGEAPEQVMKRRCNPADRAET